VRKILISSLVLAAILAVVAGALWWRGPGLRQRVLARYPRIVLVTLDTLHVESTSVINPAIDDTPELAALAAEGIVFAQARTTVPITLPSHTSLLSGRTPIGLGVLRNGQKVDPAVETLPQRLREIGYRTGAFLSLATLRREFRLDSGFEVYDDGHGEVPRFYRTADEVYAAASPWVAEHGDEPFFLWVHFSDPHEPYVLPDAPPDVVVDLDGKELGRFNLTSKERHRLVLELPPGRHSLRWTSLREPRPDDLEMTSLRLEFRDNTDLASLLSDWRSLPDPDVGLETPFVLELANDLDSGRELVVSFDGGLLKPPRSEVLENYAAEVRLVDDYFGRLRRLVEAQGQEVLWVVVSDHGEGIYRRSDIIGHAGFGLEDQLRILWFLEGPGVPSGRRLETEPALMHDVAPTVVDLLGLPPMPSAEGVSFVPCWRDGDCPRDRRWFAHGFNRRLDQVSAVAAYRWPLKALRQRAPGSGSYDLVADPWETRDLSRVRRGQRGLELRRLPRDLQEMSELLKRRLDEDSGELSDEDVDMLRSLGYLGN
jgi:arylsulfatase A-like enzyme